MEPSAEEHDACSMSLLAGAEDPLSRRRRTRRRTRRGGKADTIQPHLLSMTRVLQRPTAERFGLSIAANFPLQSPTHSAERIGRESQVTWAGSDQPRKSGKMAEAEGGGKSLDQGMELDCPAEDARNENSTSPGSEMLKLRARQRELEAAQAALGHAHAQFASIRAGRGKRVTAHANEVQSGAMDEGGVDNAFYDIDGMIGNAMQRVKALAPVWPESDGDGKCRDGCSTSSCPKVRELLAVVDSLRKMSSDAVRDAEQERLLNNQKKFAITALQNRVVEGSQLALKCKEANLQLQDKVNKLQTAMGDYRKTSEDRQKTVDGYKDANKRLMSAMDSQSSNIKSLSSTLESKQGEIERLKADLDVSQKKISDLEASRRAECAASAGHKANLSEALKDSSNLRTSLETMTKLYNNCVSLMRSNPEIQHKCVTLDVQSQTDATPLLPYISSPSSELDDESSNGPPGHLVTEARPKLTLPSDQVKSVQGTSSSKVEGQDAIGSSGHHAVLGQVADTSTEKDMDVDNDKQQGQQGQELALLNSTQAVSLASVDPAGASTQAVSSVESVCIANTEPDLDVGHIIAGPESDTVGDDEEHTPLASPRLQDETEKQVETLDMEEEHAAVEEKGEERAEFDGQVCNSQDAEKLLADAIASSECIPESIGNVKVLEPFSLADVGCSGHSRYSTDVKVAEIETSVAYSDQMNATNLTPCEDKIERATDSSRSEPSSGVHIDGAESSRRLNQPAAFSTGDGLDPTQGNPLPSNIDMPVAVVVHQDFEEPAPQPISSSIVTTGEVDDGGAPNEEAAVGALPPPGVKSKRKECAGNEMDEVSEEENKRCKACDAPQD